MMIGKLSAKSEMDGVGDSRETIGSRGVVASGAEVQWGRILSPSLYDSSSLKWEKLLESGWDVK